MIDSDQTIIWNADLGAGGTTSVTGDTVSIDWSPDGTNWETLAANVDNDGSETVRITCPPGAGGPVTNVHLRIRSEQFPLYESIAQNVAVNPLATDLVVEAANVKAKGNRIGRDSFKVRCAADPNLDTSLLADPALNYVDIFSQDGTVLTPVKRYSVVWGPLQRGKAKGELILDDDPMVPGVGSVKGVASIQVAKGKVQFGGKNVDLRGLTGVIVFRIRVANLVTRQRLPQSDTGTTVNSAFKLGKSTSARFYRGHLFVKKARFKQMTGGGLQFKAAGTMWPPQAQNCPSQWDCNTRLTLQVQSAPVMTLGAPVATRGNRCVFVTPTNTGGSITFDVNMDTGKFKVTGEDPGLQMRIASPGRSEFSVGISIEQLPAVEILNMVDGSGNWRFP